MPVFKSSLASVVLGVVAVACGGSEPEPQAPQPLVPSVTATVPAVTAAPPTATTATAPTASTPGVLEPALAQTAQAVLNELIKAEAPGAKAVGTPRVQLLNLNQSSELQLRLEPGKCYTILAVGLLPVAEVNIQLLPAIAVPGMQAVLAQDQTTGPQAVLGKAPNCFKWPLPMAGDAKVVTTVAAGTGLVATQVYAK